MAAKQLLQEIPTDLLRERMPRHVAVIMDGNGRWAKRRAMPRIMGHRKGVKVLQDLLRCCRDWGIEALTVYAFSTENWGRPTEEIEFLMTLFEQILRREFWETVQENMQIRVAGNPEMLPDSLREEIDRAVELTRVNTGIQFTIAVNYGGRQEILQACRSIAAAVKDGTLGLEDIEESVFERNLYTAGICDPDLLIRTSGEMRISNFLLWQIAYTEIYVTDTMWPDFDRTQFHIALRDYQSRERRFGKI